MGFLITAGLSLIAGEAIPVVAAALGRSIAASMAVSALKRFKSSPQEIPARYKKQIGDLVKGIKSTGVKK